MRALSAAALAVCFTLTGCIDKETREEWRATEPRLNGFGRWRECRRTPLSREQLVADVDCGATTVKPLGCGDRIVDAAAARNLLLSQPQCTDIAVEALTALSRRDPAALTDLSAAEFVSAQRNDRPSDFVRALDALRGAPLSPEQQFNRALELEKLGLRELATDAWNNFLRDGGPDWSQEAREHRDALAAQADGAAVWERHEAQIDLALAKGDRARVATLVRPFQTQAQTLLEKKLEDGRIEDASLIAGELARFGPDKYPLDVVEAWRRRPGQKNGPIALNLAITAAATIPNTATPEPFIRAGELLDTVEKEVRRRGYLHLLAKAHASRSYIQMLQGRYREAINESDKALALYEQFGDEEKIADTHMARAGLYRRAGAPDFSFREVWTALQHRDRFVTPRRFHALFGDAALTSLELGYPHVALLYQQNALAIAEKTKNNVNRAAAYREMATIKFRLQDTTAQDDLDKARRLARGEDKEARSILEARNAGVLGLKSVGAEAITALTRALDLTNAEIHTVRADLFSRRSDAKRNLNDLAGAKADLLRAIDEINAEESRMLAGRKRGDSEEIWSAYFSRFSDVYRRLIRQLLDDRDRENAFYYTEKARAAEPLDLMQAPAPTLFTRLELQRKLPRGTVLIEYAILDKETVAWLVSHDQFEAIRLPDVDRAGVERWTKAVQRGARFLREDELLPPLGEAYAKLVAPVLVEMREPPQRLVIAPDGAMHGLPFAAMHFATSKGRRFLIEQAIIEMAGSGQLYLQSLQRNRVLGASDNRSVLLIGDPAFDPSLPMARHLQRLPDAKGEIDDLRAIYPESEAFAEAQATRQRVLELAPRSAIVHIAGHSVANADAPFRSVILLARNGGDTGALYAKDLVTGLTSGQTRLVVLASCSSAGDLPVGPEGVAPLVRPLIGAGIPAVMGSLWRVKDATARQMSVSFHARYGAGEDAAEALRNVQIQWLQSNAEHKPALAWAAFQVIGHSSSPFAAAPTSKKEKPP